MHNEYFKAVVAIAIKNEDDLNCGNTNLNEDMIVAVAIVIQAIANLPKKSFGTSTGFGSLASALELQCSTN